jgi:HSP20 family protein
MNDQSTTENWLQQMIGSQPDQILATPLVDILSTPENVVLHVEMAGVDRGGVEITIENGNLLLIGHRLPSNVVGELIYSERRPVHYQRIYELDPSIDTEKITACVEDGMLTVTLPKSERVKPRRIALE